MFVHFNNIVIDGDQVCVRTGVSATDENPCPLEKALRHMEIDGSVFRRVGRGSGILV